MEQPKKGSIYKQESHMGRVVCNSSSVTDCSNPVSAYTYWNQPNITSVGYWSSLMDRGSFRLKVHNRQHNKITCQSCGCEPKTDQWFTWNSQFCIDCGGTEE